MKSEVKKPTKKIPTFQTPQSISKQPKGMNPPTPSISDKNIEAKENFDNTEAILKYIKSRLNQIKTFDIPIN
jgi:hypothetical protein